MFIRSLKLVVALMLSIGLAAGCSMPSKTQYINVGTAGTGGAYYPIGITFAELFTKQLGANSSAQVTGGAQENVTLVQKGEIEVGITTSNMAYAGYNGKEPFTSKNENVAMMFNGLSKGVLQVVVRNASGIKSLSDLKGKKVVLGPSGGGGINIVKDLLSVYNVKVEDFQATYVSYDEGISMLKDNNVDAVIVQSAAPASSIKELSVSGHGGKMDFTILSLEADKIKELLSRFNYFAEIKIPADMYNTAADISTVYGSNMVIVRKDLDEKTVYDMTKTIFENLQKVQESHPSAKDLKLESAVSAIPVPLHPGAEKYFKEKGVLKQ